ncbi:MAG: sulfatase [Hyphomonadaceae bacterium]|nr:sulfatase [Hyphomonadaceae bacterium]
MTATRRHFLASTVALAALAACATPQFANASTRKPNIVLILADDLGYGDLGSYGARAIRTPHLDRMAAEGARLTTFYASASVCTPSRAGLLTGRYPIRTGLARDVIRQTDTHGLKLSEITIAEALKPDYATALVGKWHLGHVDPFWPPTQQGFDLFFGLPYSHDMLPLSLYTKEPGVELTSEAPAMDKLTDRFFQRGLRFIDENRDRPFFLMLTLTAPHVPLDPHPDHAGHSAAAEYGDVVEEIDANMGRLFARLKELNLDDDTLVIVTSDNGPWFEGSTAGLRERKGGAGWEGGYRVPFLARHPGRIPAGLVSDSMAMNIDLLPTLAKWTGAPIPSAQLDGADISSLLTLRAAPSPHDELVLFINEDVAAIRTQRYKLVVRGFYRSFLATLDTRDDWQVLVDLENDPEESYDVSSRHPDVLADLSARLTRARATFDPLKTPTPASPPAPATSRG